MYTLGFLCSPGHYRLRRAVAATVPTALTRVLPLFPNVCDVFDIAFAVQFLFIVNFVERLLLPAKGATIVSAVTTLGIAPSLPLRT